MIGYFPPPYKDEVIYSIIARYHHHMGNKSKFHTLEELFSKTVSLNTEYVNNLNQLSSKIDYFYNNHSGDELLNNHTTAPLYYPFNKTILLNKNPFILPSLYRYRKRFNDIKPKENLHLCMDCLKEQIEELGEGYWNRFHQVPGIYVCLKHKKPLLKHPINIERLRINGFVLPEVEASNQMSIYELDYIEEHLNIAEDVEFFFNYGACFLERELYKKYLTVMKIKGIAFPMSQMLKNLSDLLLTTYGDEFLNCLDSNLKENNWIYSLFHENELFNIHPVRHILLMRALSGSVKSFLQSSDVFEPFGEGPWVCMNPLSDHYLKKIVNKVEVSIHRAKRTVQGEFLCDCGFEYRLLQGESDPSKVPSFSNRVMKKGHVWKRNFYKMVNGGLKINEMAAKTNLSRTTIRKMLREGVDPIQNAIQKKDIQVKESRKKKTATYRKVWKNAVNSNPDYTRMKLANLNRAAYAWLHQFDSEWLEGNSPKSQRGYQRKVKDDFENKDILMWKEVQRINVQWKQQEEIRGQIKRKTFTAICDLLGRSTIKKEKFPITFSYVRSIQESVEEFQKRKVKHTLETYFEDKYVTKNQLLEKSGIRRSIKPSVIPYVEEILEKHNNQ